MSAVGSDPPPPAMPALAACAAVVVGTVALLGSQYLAIRTLGLRPTLMLSEASLAAPALLLAWAFRVPRREGLGLRGVDRRTALLALAIGVALWGTSLGLFELQYVFWKPAEGYLEAFRRLHDALRPSGPFDALISILAIAVGPAVCEELLIRGVVLPAFWRHMPAAGALLWSAVVFGLIHLDAYRFAFTLLAGLVLGLLRIRTGSLVPSMSAHAVLNTITLVA